MKKIFLATGNEGKIQRFRHLLREAGIDVEIYTPKDLDLENIEVLENGKNLRENAVRLDPDGKIFTAESRREVILTDHVFGDAHIQLPVRALYISKATNKPSLQQTKKEELLELKPVTDALKKILESN